MNRINYITTIIGRRGCGKTEYIKGILDVYRNKENSINKLIIFDTADNKSYSKIPIIDVEKLKTVKSGYYRIISGKINDVMNMLTSLHNALIIFEDATKYIQNRLTEEQRAIVFDSKQKNCDLIFVFHGFGYVPIDMYRISDNLTIFKTLDKPFIRKQHIINYEGVEAMYNKVSEHSSEYHHDTLQIY